MDLVLPCSKKEIIGSASTQNMGSESKVSCPSGDHHQEFLASEQRHQHFSRARSRTGSELLLTHADSAEQSLLKINKRPRGHPQALRNGRLYKLLCPSSRSLFLRLKRFHSRSALTASPTLHSRTLDRIRPRVHQRTRILPRLWRLSRRCRRTTA